MPMMLHLSLLCPDSSMQLLQVVFDRYDGFQAELSLWERADVRVPWQCIDGPTPAVGGKSGLAIDASQAHQFPPEIQKKCEGDKRTPCGIFRLGIAFGSANAAVWGLGLSKFPFRVMTSASFCVDDPESVHYNQIVEFDARPTPWTTAERMNRDDNLYQLGLVVHQNCACLPGDGSCMFVHCWRNASSPTDGCIALDEERLRTFIGQLDIAKQPMIVIGAKSESQNLRP